MSKSPAFLLYAGDFLSGTSDMSAEEVGAYIRLLCHQWLHGSVPDDTARLARISQCTSDALAFVVHKFSRCEDGALRNAKLESIREERSRFSASRSENASKRWKKAKTDASALTVHKVSTASGEQVQCFSSSSSNMPPLVPQGGEEQPEEDSKPEGEDEKPSKPKKLPTTESATRIHALFNRRETTSWSDKEIRAFKKLHPIDLSELSEIEEFYEHERKKGDEGIHRRDLCTFLNNFYGELDKARNWKRQSAHGRPSAGQNKPTPLPNEFDVFVAENPHFKTDARFMEQLPCSTRDAFIDWRAQRRHAA